MLEKLTAVPADPLLGIAALMRADPADRKVDLGVGVYRNPAGITPVMAAVRAAEQRVIDRQATKSYVGPAGNRDFAAAMQRIVFGPQHPALLDGRIATLQTPGGCGALRLVAELLRRAGYDNPVHVSNPTWANHVPLLQGAGLRIEQYPYYDMAQRRLTVERMLDAIRRLPEHSVVLLQASCHNPTGADPAAAVWDELAGIMEQRHLIPLLDLAYQGLGSGLDVDAEPIRMLAQRLPEAFVAISCSKNFGLYRERVGALLCVASNKAQAEISMGHMQNLARGIYSMPPDHGAAIVAEIAGDAQLEAQWQQELTSMRERVRNLRRALADSLQRALGDDRYAGVAEHQGMFSLLGLPPAAVLQLRTGHHVYTAPDSRINVAGLKGDEIDYVAQAIASVARQS